VLPFESLQTFVDVETRSIMLLLEKKGTSPSPLIGFGETGAAKLIMSLQECLAELRKLPLPE